MRRTALNLYSAFIGKAIRCTFPLWQKLGVHVVRNHFYEPVPDTRKLDERLWSNRSELVGIDLNEQRQLEILSHFKTSFCEEYSQFPIQKTDVPYKYYIRNGFFEAVDGEILYCMIRHFKPKCIIEIGGGYSTYLSAQAILRNKEKDNHECDLIAIEPYPNMVLIKGFPGLSQLLSKRVQDVPVSDFEQLNENDILFIDSSHMLKIGSDVQYVFLEILPRLKKGVCVCFHDIFLPAEYPKEWVLKRHYFWNEQYLLQAFLAFNKSFEVLWASSYMHLNHPKMLADAFASYNSTEQHWPGCLWIRRTK